MIVMGGSGSLLILFVRIILPSVYGYLLIPEYGGRPCKSSFTLSLELKLETTSVAGLLFLQDCKVTSSRLAEFIKSVCKKYA